MERPGLKGQRFVACLNSKLRADVGGWFAQSEPNLRVPGALSRSIIASAYDERRLATWPARYQLLPGTLYCIVIRSTSVWVIGSSLLAIPSWSEFLRR